MQNWLTLNVLLLLTVMLGGTMMVLWARATRGRWPGRRRLQLTAAFLLAVWPFSNLAYFYFRSH